MAHLTRDVLRSMGFAALGDPIWISNLASFHNCSNISIGHNVRIDDFCVLSAGTGGIEIGNFVHIAVHTSIIGAGRVEIRDFANLSSRVSVYSSSDDYSGVHMTNPTVPAEFTGVTSAPVIIDRHVAIGCGSVVLPGCTINEGAVIGALSLVNCDCDQFSIYAGVPAKRIKNRRRDLLIAEQNMLLLQSRSSASMRSFDIAP